ncbi:3-hydroxyisobutyryl-CoA hydrolase [Cryptotrichosporon argae]
MTLLRSARTSSRSLSAASVRLASVSRHLASSSPAMAAPPASELVAFESLGASRVYRLNRPKALNALNREMITALTAKVTAWRESELCQLVVGMGDERAFCAGGDVKGLVLGQKEGKDEALAFFKDEFELNWLLGRLGKPYVAVIDGIVMGGGAGLSLPAPIRVATSRTVFAMPETKIGYAPDVGANYYLAQLDGQIGAWLAVTGQEVYGRAVYELGLATHYVEPSTIADLVHQLTQLASPTLETVGSLVATYTTAPTTAVPSSKASPDGPSPITGEVRVALDRAFSKSSVKDIYDALGEIAAEGGEAAVWAKTQQGLMNARSPTGMAVALENFKSAKAGKSLQKALRNDILMATGFAGPSRSTDDFTTGVTHLLIEKASSRAPWSPSALDDAALSPAAIKAAFLTRGAESAAPELALDPAPVKREGPDSTWGRFRAHGLPSEATVRAWVEGDSPNAGAFKVKEHELLDRLVKAGPRAHEERRRAAEIVARHCEKDDEGYLNWKR